jgi:hypothetical protein
VRGEIKSREADLAGAEMNLLTILWPFLEIYKENMHIISCKKGERLK